MKRLVSEITIGSFRFNYTAEVNIDESWDTFTDTASIEMPNKFLKDNKQIAVGENNVFSRGDAVEIKLGYFPNLQSRFKGFVSKIVPDSPLKIMCEDRMYLMKQKNIKSKSFKETTIKEVIDYVAPDEIIDYDTPDANIGLFEIDNKAFVNAVTIFETLKKQFGFKIYYRGDRLQVRALNSILSKDSPVHEIGFQRNVISSTLAYIKEDDVDTVIKAESILEDNTRIIRFGFKDNRKVIIDDVGRDGQTKSLKMYNLKKKEVDEEIVRRIDNFIYEGYKGAFTTFLEPSVEHSDKIKLIDNKNIEREGTYLIKRVSTSFGAKGGGRQTIELTNKVA